MATEYISTETGCQYLRKYKIEAGTSFLYDEGFNDGIETAISCIGSEIPAADVVARDCYDRILAENDTMRNQLAKVGKKVGDSMDDVRPVVRARWKAHGDCGVTECPVCRWSIEECIDYNFCPNCGADMREVTTMADFPIYCHIRYDAEPNKNGKLEIACTDVSDHDFVEVVRCKDCINWNGNDCITMWGLKAPSPNDYCSRGERMMFNGN